MKVMLCRVLQALGRRFLHQPAKFNFRRGARWPCSSRTTLPETLQTGPAGTAAMRPFFAMDSNQAFGQQPQDVLGAFGFALDDGALMMSADFVHGHGAARNPRR